MFYYHSDHLGSTSYITDRDGSATQFVCYKPYGEALVDEHNTSYEQPWKFNGKELDSETGLYYYGARYYEPVLALWYGVNALAEKYPTMGSYVYCAGNPVRLVDVDGNEPTANEVALMAIHVYRDDNAEGYLKKLNALGWFISNVADGIKLNYTQWYEKGLQSEVFERTSNGVTEYAYVFAGTNSLEDALEDIAQVIYFAPQYDVAILNALAISKATNGHELTFVGHSLGGGKAAAASMALGHRAITFNAAAVSPLSKFRYGLSDDSQITNYVIIGRNGSFFKGGDPLTNIQDAIGLKAPGKRISIPIQSSDWVHTINEFLKHDLPEL